MGIFSKFRKGLKKTRTEGITAQLDDVMESHQEITDDLYDDCLLYTSPSPRD